MPRKISKERSTQRVHQHRFAFLENIDRAPVEGGKHHTEFALYACKCGVVGKPEANFNLAEPGFIAELSQKLTARGLHPQF